MIDGPVLAEPSPERRRVALSGAASIGLHGLLALAVIWASPLRQLVVPAPEAVTVEIVTPAEFAALEAPADTPVPLTSPAPAETTAPAAPGVRLPPSGPLEPVIPQSKPVTATQFYSARLLAQPGMARIRRTLTTLADSERVSQLCNIEGIEQIRRAAPQYAPDTIVGYAMADPMWSGLTLTATGGAFRSRRRWYGLSFSCTVAADFLGVTAYAFQLGNPIPEAVWDERGLNAADADE